MQELSPIQKQQLAKQRVKDCFIRACDYLKQHFILPNISFNQRGKIAGSARLQINEIRLNPHLLEDNFDEFINEVIPHEVCHLIAFQLFGKVRPHGKEWQSLMKALYDLKGTPYHNMNVDKVSGKMFEYKCLCGPTKLSIRRHNKVVKGRQQYCCRHCNSVLIAT